jgi:hypothetical protein
MRSPTPPTAIGTTIAQDATVSLPMLIVGVANSPEGPASLRKPVTRQLFSGRAPVRQTYRTSSV